MSFTSYVKVCVDPYIMLTVGKVGGSHGDGHYKMYLAVIQIKT